MEKGSNQREDDCFWDHFLSLSCLFAYLNMFPFATDLKKKIKKSMFEYPGKSKFKNREAAAQKVTEKVIFASWPHFYIHG